MTQLFGGETQDARQIQDIQRSQEELLKAQAENQARWDVYLHTKMEDTGLDLSKIMPREPPVLYDPTPVLTPDFIRDLGVDPDKAEAGEYVKKEGFLAGLDKIPWQNALQTLSVTTETSPTVASSDINVFRILQMLAKVPSSRRAEALYKIQNWIYEKAVVERLAVTAIEEEVGPDWLQGLQEAQRSGGFKGFLASLYGGADVFSEQAASVGFMDDLTGFISHTLGLPIKQSVERAQAIAREAFKEAPESYRETMVQIVGAAARKKILAALGLKPNSWTTRILEGAGGITGFAIPLFPTAGVLRLGRKITTAVASGGTKAIAKALAKVAPSSGKVAKLVKSVEALAEGGLKAGKLKAIGQIAKAAGVEAGAGAFYEGLLALGDKHHSVTQGAITFGILGALGPIMEMVAKRIDPHQAYKLYTNAFKGATTGFILHHADPTMFDIGYRLLADPSSVTPAEKDAYLKTMVGSMAGMTLASAAEALDQARDILATEIPERTADLLREAKVPGYQALRGELKKFFQYKLMDEKSEEWKNLPDDVKEKSPLMATGIRGVPRAAIEGEGMAPPDINSPAAAKSVLLDGLGQALTSPDMAQTKIWTSIIRAAGKDLIKGGEKAAGKAIVDLANKIERVRAAKGGLFGRLPGIPRKPLSEDEAQVVLARIEKSLRPWLGGEPSEEPGMPGFTTAPKKDTKEGPRADWNEDGLIRFQIGDDGSRVAILQPAGEHGRLVFKYSGTGVDVIYTSPDGQKLQGSGPTPMAAMQEMGRKMDTLDDVSRENLEALGDIFFDEIQPQQFEWLSTGKVPQKPSEEGLKKTAESLVPQVMDYLNSVPEGERGEAYARIAGKLRDAGLDMEFLEGVAAKVHAHVDPAVRKLKDGLLKEVATDPLYRAGATVWVGFDKDFNPIVSSSPKKGEAWVGLTRDLPRAQVDRVLEELAYEAADRRRIGEPPEIPKKLQWYLFKVESDPKDPDYIRVERVDPTKEVGDGTFVGLAPAKGGFVQKIVRIAEGKAEEGGLEMIGEDREISAILRKAGLQVFSEVAKGAQIPLSAGSKAVAEKAAALAKAGVIHPSVAKALEFMAREMGPKADVVLRVVEKVHGTPGPSYGKAATKGEPMGATRFYEVKAYGPDTEVPFHMALIDIAKGANVETALHEFLHYWWFQQPREVREKVFSEVQKLPGSDHLISKDMAPDEIFAQVVAKKVVTGRLPKDFLEKTGLPRGLAEFMDLSSQAVLAESTDVFSPTKIWHEIMGLVSRPALPAPEYLSKYEGESATEIAASIEKARGLTGPETQKAGILYKIANEKAPEPTLKEVLEGYLKKKEEGDPRVGADLVALQEIRALNAEPTARDLRTLQDVNYVFGDKPFRLASDGTLHLDLPHASALPVFRGWKAPQEGAIRRVMLGLAIDVNPELVADYVAAAVSIQPEAAKSGVYLGEVGDLLNSNSVRFVKRLGARLHAYGVPLFVFTGRPDLAKDVIGTPGVRVFERLAINAEQAYRLAVSTNPKDLYLSDVGPGALRLALQLYGSSAQAVGIKDPIGLIQRISVKPALKRNPEMLQEMIGVLQEFGIRDPESLFVDPHDVSRAQAQAYTEELARKTDVLPSPLAWKWLPDQHFDAEPGTRSAVDFQRSHEAEARLRQSMLAARDLLLAPKKRRADLPDREAVESMGPGPVAVWLNAHVLHDAMKKKGAPSILWVRRNGRVEPKDAAFPEIMDEAYLWHPERRKAVRDALKALKEALKKGEAPGPVLDRVVKAVDAWENNTAAPKAKDLVPYAAWLSAGGTGFGGEWGRSPMYTVLESIRSAVEAYRRAPVDLETARQLMDEARLIMSDPAGTLLNVDYSTKRTVAAGSEDPLHDMAMDLLEGDWLPGVTRLHVEVEPNTPEKMEREMKAHALEELEGGAKRIAKAVWRWDSKQPDVGDFRGLSQKAFVRGFHWLFSEADKVFGTKIPLTFHDMLAQEGRKAKDEERILKEAIAKVKGDDRMRELFLRRVDAGNDETVAAEAQKEIDAYAAKNPVNGKLLKEAVQEYEGVMQKLRPYAAFYSKEMIRARKRLRAETLRLAHYKTMTEQRAREMEGAQNIKDRRKIERSRRYYEGRLKEIQARVDEIEAGIKEYMEKWGQKYYYPHRWVTTHPLWEGAGPFKKMVLWLLGTPRTIPAQRKEAPGQLAEGKVAPSAVTGTHFRHREGRLGYSLDLEQVLPAYIHAIHRNIAYNRAMEYLDTTINGRRTPVDGRWGLLRPERSFVYYMGGKWRFLGRVLGEDGEPTDKALLQSLSDPDRQETVSVYDKSLQVQTGGIRQMVELQMGGGRAGVKAGEYAERVMKEYTDRIRGLVDRHAKTLLGATVEGISRRLRQWCYHTLLGILNLPAAFQNLMGGQLMSSVEFGPKYWWALYKVATNPGLRRQILRQTRRLGVTDFTLFKDEIANTKAGTVAQWLTKASFFPFSGIEFVNRVTAYAAGYYLATEQGLKGRAAHMAALKGVSRSQFLFSAAMTPEAFQNEFFKTFAMLWQYQFRFMGRVGSWSKQAFVKDEAGQRHFEYLLRYLINMGLWGVALRAVGIDPFDSIGTYMDRLPWLKDVGTKLRADMGFRIPLPVLFPFGLSAPVKLITDMAEATKDQYLGTDPEAIQKAVVRNRTIIFGSMFARVSDILSAEKQPDGIFVIRYPQNIGEVLGFLHRTGTVSKQRMSLDQMILDIAAGSHTHLDEFLYNNQALINLRQKQFYGRAKMYRNAIQRGARLMALGHAVDGAALIRRGLYGLAAEGYPLPSKAYMDKYAAQVNVPKDLMMLLRISVPKDKKVAILTELLAEENRAGVYHFRPDDLNIVLQYLFRGGVQDVRPQTQQEFLQQYKVYQQRIMEK